MVFTARALSCGWWFHVCCFFHHGSRLGTGHTGQPDLEGIWIFRLYCTAASGSGTRRCEVRLIVCGYKILNLRDIQCICDTNQQKFVREDYLCPWYHTNDISSSEAPTTSLNMGKQDLVFDTGHQTLQENLRQC